MNKSLTGVLALAVLTVSCIKVENLPDTPMVEFRSFTLSDSTDRLGNRFKAGTLTFYFEDGDGDLGISETTDTEADTTNLFLTLFRKSGGVFTQAADDDPLRPAQYRIPHLEPIGQNDVLKGTIDIIMFYYIYSETDTLYYNFCIKDRAGNYSNTDSTCVIVLGEDGTFTR